MKRIIFTFAIAVLGIVSCWAGKKEVVWEKPSAFIIETGSQHVVTKMELKEDETVMHVHISFRPHYWIRFAKESVLRAEDGKEYALVSGKKTNEQEADLVPDSLFWMPDSGEADLALHFEPLPLDTKVVDFAEGDDEGAFRYWNICDSKTKQKLVLPEEWRNVKYAKDEALPEARINQGVATVRVKVLGYKPGMGLKLMVGGFKPLGFKETLDKEFPFADDGTVVAEVPMWLARTVYVGIQGVGFADCVLAPGEETSILMRLTNGGNPFLAFKGFLAKTNMEMVTEEHKNEGVDEEKETLDAIGKCNTSEERLKYLKAAYERQLAHADAVKYTTAAKALMRMKAEGNYLEWTRFFAYTYTRLLFMRGILDWDKDDYGQKIKEHEQLLPLPEEESKYTIRYLNEPYSPCSKAFWKHSLNGIDAESHLRNSYNHDLQLAATVLELYEGKPNEMLMEKLQHDDCKAVVEEYHAGQLRVAAELASAESVFCQKYDDVAPEDILPTILAKYRGKAVLIDVWATWCGPCRAGHKAMAPLKEELKGENVQFVYITSPTSPLSTWQDMIGDITGDHYYLTKEQYSHILDLYDSSGIPTYAIYNTQGEQTYKAIGFPGNEKIKEGLEKARR